MLAQKTKFFFDFLDINMKKSDLETKKTECLTSL